MRCNGVKMYFTSPVHIGKQGIGMEGSDLTIHSDTLYSVIFQTLLRMYGTIDKGELSIRLTSAFPFVGSLYYLPKPGIRPPGIENAELPTEYAKEIKSASYVTVDLFRKWIGGEALDFEALRDSQQELKRHIKVSVRPRVTVDRVCSDTALYFEGSTFYRRGQAGLYFLVQCGEKEWEMIRRAFVFLQEEGIGGERSLGYGKFKVEFLEDFELPSIDDGEKYVTLSLYHPQSGDEIKDAALSYQLVQRCGWSIIEGRHVLQKKVLMFAEGSVFSREVEGDIVDVSPLQGAHPVYKYGRAFLVKAR